MVLLYNFIAIAFNVYTAVIFLRVILSWFPISANNRFVRFLAELADPFLNIFRRLMPPRPGMALDFSPILAILALQVIETIVLRILYIFI